MTQSLRRPQKTHAIKVAASSRLAVYLPPGVSREWRVCSPLLLCNSQTPIICQFHRGQNLNNYQISFVTHCVVMKCRRLRICKIIYICALQINSYHIISYMSSILEIHFSKHTFFSNIIEGYIRLTFYILKHCVLLKSQVIRPIWASWAFHMYWPQIGHPIWRIHW